MRYESILKNNNFSYGWFKREFSMMDINGDGFTDLIITHGKDSTSHVHYGSVNGIDTIPSFYITDPDTTIEDVIVGRMSHDIGDFNNDGYNDFILKESYYKSFSLHLGGPRLSNKNPYGIRGLLGACTAFPSKAINCGDQNGDGVKDFIVISPCGQTGTGYILIFLGDPSIVTDIYKDEDLRPELVQLLQNYPNPFNSATAIQYEISSRQNVTLKVFDILGKEITTLINEEKAEGKYQIEFDANKYNLASGIYFCEIKLNGTSSKKIKMIYLK